MTTEIVLEPISSIPEFKQVQEEQKPDAKAEIKVAEVETKKELTPEDTVSVTGEEVVKRQLDSINGLNAEERLEIHASDPEGIKKRIKKMADQKNEARRLYAEKEKENAELRKKLELISQPGNQPGPRQEYVPPVQQNPETVVKNDNVLKEPNPDEFQSYDDYTKALARYETKLTIKQEVEAAARERAQQRQLEAIISKQKTFMEQVQTARQSLPDYDAVSFNAKLPVNALMQDAIMESPKGAEVLYYLGKNPHIASEIFNSSPISAIKTIGRIEQQFMQTANIKSLKSPPKPIRTLSGSSSSDYESSSEPSSHEEYIALRRAGKI